MPLSRDYHFHYPKTTQQKYHLKEDSGCTQEAYQKVLGESMALVIQHHYDELYCLFSQTQVILYGISAELWLKGKAQSISNQANVEIRYSFKVTAMERLLKELSLLKIYYQRYGSDVQIGAARYWELRLRQRRQTICHGIQVLLHGSTQIKQESPERTMLEKLCNFLRALKI